MHQITLKNSHVILTSNDKSELHRCQKIENWINKNSHYYEKNYLTDILKLNYVAFLKSDSEVSPSMWANNDKVKFENEILKEYNRYESYKNHAKNPSKVSYHIIPFEVINGIGNRITLTLNLGSIII